MKSFLSLTFICFSIFVFSQSENVTMDSTVRRFSTFDFSKKINITVVCGIFCKEQMAEAGLGYRQEARPVDTLSLRREYYSRCDIMYDIAPWEKVDEITIEFSCNRKVITGTNREGELKWERSTKKLTNPYVSLIRRWETGRYGKGGKWDVLIFFDKDTFYVLKSKNGKMKKVTRTDLFNN